MDNGRSLIEVDVTTRLSRYQIWFDPEVNFLVRKLVGSITEADGRVYKGECLVHRFMELAPGLYFPEGVGNLEEGVELTASFTNVLANRPIGAEAFRLSFPPGIVMTDFVRGTVYRVDPDGRDIGPVLDARGKPITLTSAIQLPSVGGPGASNGPTAEEPASWTVWLLPASLGWLLVSLALWIGRRWRASHG